MDIDSTQAIDFESEEEEVHDKPNNTQDVKRPVATLKLLTYDAAPDKFFVFKGLNIIGRGDAVAQINLVGKGVSKKHAIIEVDSDIHMVYDLNSRNKTRKGKTILKPQVRYELKDGDVLTFGDVACTYSVFSQVEEFDSGSETGSELLLPRSTPTPPLVTNDSNKVDAGVKENAVMQLLSGNEVHTVSPGDANHSGDVLSEGIILQSDSEECDKDIVPSSIPPKPTRSPVTEGVLVPETPKSEELSRNKNPDTDKKSDDVRHQFHLDSETDEDKTDDEMEALLDAPTQVYPLEENIKVLQKNADHVKDVKQPTVSKKPMTVMQSNETLDWMDLPTQPYILETENNRENDDETEDWMNMATQVFTPASTEELNNKTSHDEKVVEKSSHAEILKIPVLADQQKGETRRNDSESSDEWSNMPTQVFPSNTCQDISSEDDVFTPSATECTAEANKTIRNAVDDKINFACADTLPIDEIEAVVLSKQVSEKIASSTAKDEVLFTSPCSDEDFQQVKKDIQKAIESPALASSSSSQEEPASKCLKSTEIPVRKDRGQPPKSTMELGLVTNSPKQFSKLSVSNKNTESDTQAPEELNSRCKTKNAPIKGIAFEKVVKDQLPETPSSVVQGTDSGKNKNSSEEQKCCLDKSSPTTRLTRKKLKGKSANTSNSENCDKVHPATNTSVERSSQGHANSVKTGTKASSSSTVPTVSTPQIASPGTRTSTRRSRCNDKLSRRIISNEEEGEDVEDAFSVLDSGVAKSGKVAKISKDSAKVKDKRKPSNVNKMLTESEKSEVEMRPTRASNRITLADTVEKLKGHIIESKKKIDISISLSSKNAAVTFDDEEPSSGNPTEISEDDQPSENVQRQQNRKASRSSNKMPSSGMKLESPNEVRQSQRIAKKKSYIGNLKSALCSSDSENALDKVGEKSPLQSFPNSRAKRAKPRKSNEPQKRVRTALADDKVLKETPGSTNGNISTRQSKTMDKALEMEGTPIIYSTRQRRGSLVAAASDPLLCSEDKDSMHKTTQLQNSTFTVKQLHESFPDIIPINNLKRNKGAVLSGVGDQPVMPTNAHRLASQSKKINKRAQKASVSQELGAALASQVTKEDMEEFALDGASPSKRQKVQLSSEDKHSTLKRKIHSPRIVVGLSAAVDDREECEIASNSTLVINKSEELEPSVKRNTGSTKKASTPTQRGRKSKSMAKPVARRSQSKEMVDQFGNAINNDEEQFTSVLSKTAPPPSPATATSKHSKDGTTDQDDVRLKDIPKIMFTGISENKLEKIVKLLKGEMVDSIFDCSHLVTDKVRRTWKFLCLLARGCCIVTPSWLHDCEKAKAFIDATSYIVEDNTAESQYQFCLRESISKAKSKPFLQDLKVHVTRNVVPKPQEMRTIIECAGGKFLARMPLSGGDTIIVTCPKDYTLCTKARSGGIPIVGTEFILTGVLRQEASIEEYLC